MLRKGALFVLGLTIAAAVMAGGGFFWSEREHERPGPLESSVTIVVKPGASLRGIADALDAANVIRYADLFFWKTRLDGLGGAVKAGEYAFEPGIAQRDVLRKLIEHDIVQRFVTIPEGLTSTEVVALLAGVAGLASAVGEVPPEGSLLPETYSFSLGDSARTVLDRMRRAAQSAREDLWPDRAADLPFDTWDEAVILASIVEKETGVTSERARVAGVFVNRLRKGMRLQSDPTVIYGITLGKAPFGRALRRSDLNADTPYNTYTRGGLPPGPISNPGRAALAAVLNPTESDALYFVANGTGGHAFARTLAEHNRNVAKWRKLEKNKSRD